MKTDRGTVWIHLGLLLLAAALFLTAYNTMASHEAGETSRQVIEPRRFLNICWMPAGRCPCRPSTEKTTSAC